jgi:DNA adenine methylase
MKPILKYPGAKWRLAPWVISYMPPHKVYLEPYFGSGAVFFQKDTVQIEIINDIDGEVVNFFKICRDNPSQLAEALELTPWSREERTLAFEHTDNNLERARRFAVKVSMSIGPYCRQTSGYKCKNKPDTANDITSFWQHVPKQIATAGKRLLYAQIDNRPAVEVIQRNNTSDVLIYADPPYVTSTIQSHDKLYAHEMTDADHIEMLEALKAHKGFVLLSGYDNDIYRDYLQGWIMRQKSTLSMASSKRNECLWINPAASKCITQQSLF